tara:strand:+ start:2178 stop:2732 length:555 start_codon:yes stop_codon:yes gene_type:complete
LKKIFLFFFHSLIIAQQAQHQDNYGYDGPRRFQYPSENINSLWEKIGDDRFYHNKFLPSIINGNKVKVKFDAYSDLMYVNFRPNWNEYISPSSNDLIILLDNKEPWIAFNQKWYRLLFRDGNSSYLYKPIKELFQEREASSGYQRNEPPEFKLEEKYFILKDGKLSKLKRKEIKKLALEKIIKG